MEAQHSERIGDLMQIMGPVNDFFTNSRWAQHRGETDICDFVLGDPHEMPLLGFTAALKKWAEPRNQDWFAYKDSEREAQAAVAASLRRRRGVPFGQEDILMTNGAFAGLAVTLAATTDPGDEVIFVSPPWFFYESLIAAAGARPVRVRCDPDTFNLDVDAIAAAITARTQAIILNSPNNPTGKIYPAGILEKLAAVLEAANAGRERPIALLSDEAYCRIVYDGRNFPSPTAFYPHSFLIYTYGKTLLTPGQRLGYVALPPQLRGREQWRSAIFAAQLVTGYAFPNALLQHAVADIVALSIDVEHLEEKRDWFLRALRKMGYQLQVPEGTFYLLVRSPLGDDHAFLRRLADPGVFCLPGSIVECPGHFRVSLTANDEMIERALPAFAAAIQG